LAGSGIGWTDGTGVGEGDVSGVDAVVAELVGDGWVGPGALGEGATSSVGVGSPVGGEDVTALGSALPTRLIVGWWEEPTATTAPSTSPGRTMEHTAARTLGRGLSS
jgi:hypothetical protein